MMKLKKIKYAVLIIIFFLSIVPVSQIHAQLDCSGDGGCVPIDGSSGFGGGGGSSSGTNFTNPPSSSSCNATTRNIGDLICKLGALINASIPLLLGLGVLYFVWGVISYVIGDDEEAKKKGRDKIIFGIIGLAVIVGMWGLVSLVVNTFNLNGNSAQVVTTFVNQNKTLFASPTSCTFSGSNLKIADLFNYVTCIINSSIIPLIFAVAMVSFVWGVVQYVINGDDESKKTKGRDFMLWGVIALAVMVSVWGLVGLLGNTFNIRSAIPQVQPPK